MIAEHPVWFLLTVACVVWYSTITLYVAVRGFSDIRSMLARIAEEKKQDKNA